MKFLSTIGPLVFLCLAVGCGESGARVPDQTELNQIAAANAEARAAAEKAGKEMEEQMKKR